MHGTNTCTELHYSLCKKHCVAFSTFHTSNYLINFDLSPEIAMYKKFINHIKNIKRMYRQKNNCK